MPRAASKKPEALYVEEVEVRDEVLEVPFVEFVEGIGVVVTAGRAGGAGAHVLPSRCRRQCGARRCYR